MSKPRVILIGNPNTGKSTLFNQLTGFKQATGNYPGVTVETASGSWKEYEVIDFPGTYSLSPNSLDQKKVADFFNTQIRDTDTVFLVTDATSLAKSSKLIADVYKQFKGRLVLVLNMCDLLQLSGKEVDVKALSKALDIPVIPVNARLSKNLEALHSVFSKNNTIRRSIPSEEIVYILSNAVRNVGKNKVSERTKRIDKLLIHNVWGYAIYMFILFIVFQLLFTVSAYPANLIDEGMFWFSEYIHNLLPKGIVNDLITQGLLSGLAGVLVFVPQITFLFLFLSFLEQVGYMSRVSHLFDSILSAVGLGGRSMLPLMGSMACAVPAIMSARTIASRKERLLTILTAPLVSCSARLPIYTVLIALLVDANAYKYGINLQGLILFLLYSLGFILVFAVSFIFKYLLSNHNEPKVYILELPDYKKPVLKSVLITVFDKVWSFVYGAGKIIISVSIVIWVLSSYGPASFENDKRNEINTVTLESSYLGKAAKKIEPLITPLGYDWKIGVGLLTSFVAREVFVSTMYTLYGIEEEENTERSFLQRMRNETYSNGEKVYTLATIISLLLFYAFAMQCMTTMAVVYSETQSLKWVIFQFVYMFVLAYSSALLAYQWIS